MRRSKEKYQPAKRTIEPIVPVVKVASKRVRNLWQKFHTCRFYWIRGNFPKKKYRGKMVRIDRVSKDEKRFVVHFADGMSPSKKFGEKRICILPKYLTDRGIYRRDR